MATRITDKKTKSTAQRKIPNRSAAATALTKMQKPNTGKPSAAVSATANKLSAYQKNNAGANRKSLTSSNSATSNTALTNKLRNAPKSKTTSDVTATANKVSAYRKNNAGATGKSLTSANATTSNARTQLTQYAKANPSKPSGDFSATTKKLTELRNSKTATYKKLK